MRTTGRYISSSVSGETVKAFVPLPLPPEPPLLIDDKLQQLIEETQHSLGKLDSAASFLPDISFLLYTYIRKEAVLSSQIEGTQSTLTDLLLFELDETPSVSIEDVSEVSNYVKALYHGVERLKEGFPISLRFVRELHAVLLSSGRGAHKEPGEFRRSQNWIGGTRPGKAHFVPPSPEHLMQCLDAFEKFIHNDSIRISNLIRIALTHVQFETIHPFLDGNGRVGRLLIVLQLMDLQLLSSPVLYLSLYFKEKRDEYYARLDAVRTDGDWEGWIRFFLEAVQRTAENTLATTKNLSETFKNDRERVVREGRKGPLLQTVLSVFTAYPVQSIARICKKTGRVPNTVADALRTLSEIGIIREITGKKRNRLFMYQGYVKQLEKGLND